MSERSCWVLKGFKNQMPSSSRSCPEWDRPLFLRTRCRPVVEKSWDSKSSSKSDEGLVPCPCRCPCCCCCCCEIATHIRVEFVSIRRHNNVILQLMSEGTTWRMLDDFPSSSPPHQTQISHWNLPCLDKFLLLVSSPIIMHSLFAEATRT
jgi:hypothetical protein